MSDALIVGESLVDIVLRGGGPPAMHPGGSAANAAVALARLGRPTRLLTSFAADEHGRRLAEHFAAAGVALAAEPAILQRTGSAVATLGADTSASYVFDIQWRVPAGAIRPPHRLHVSSLAPVLHPGAGEVHRLLDEMAGVWVSYDINVRPSITGGGDDVRHAVEQMVRRANLVKASDEDLDVLYPGLGPDDAAAHLLGLGPRAVVVTRGADGSTWYGSHPVHVRAERVEVVDTIGAGDTFSGALLDSLWDVDIANISADDITRTLTRAGAAAAITVSRPGAEPPTSAELASVLRAHPSRS